MSNRRTRNDYQSITGNTDEVTGHSVSGSGKSKMGWWTRLTNLEKWLAILLILISLLAVGLLVPVIVLSQQTNHEKISNSNPYLVKVKQNLTEQSQIRNLLFEELSPEKIRNNLRSLTKKVHVAGTKENMEVLAQVYDAYKRAGLDSVQYTPYDVLLSYPNYSNPNTVSVKEGNQWVLVSNGTGESLGPPEALKEESDPKSLIWWNAWSANGTVEGPLVYANHGTLEDYEILENMNISLSGKIVLVRYGLLWRGSKVYEAEKRGAKGVIIFSDPEDYGPPSNDSGNVFPKSIYLPPEGAQRGSLMQVNGDPLTPFYPSKNYIYRSKTVKSLKDELVIPNVPVMPIGYRDARTLFEHMSDGPAAPRQFVGGLQPTSLYRVSSNKVYRLTVHSRLNPRGAIKNVIGVLKGREEPDRMVLLSNHVDAWTYGGQDPNSGTAVLLELSRTVMTVVKRTGWRPRRSIVFCSWDAEEYGLVGSVEWVEEYFKVLQSHAVAVINVDMAVKGNVSIAVSAVPLLYQVLVEASHLVPNPNSQELEKGRKTVFDSWFFYNNPGNSSYLPPEKGTPLINIPGSGSDHETFLVYVGVPVVDMTYVCHSQIDCNKLYHTMYEIAWMMENLVDPGFKTHVALAKLWIEIVRSIADSLVIPFNVQNYATMLKSFIIELETFLKKNSLDQPKLIPKFNDTFAHLKDASSRFMISGEKFQNLVDQANSGLTSVPMVEVEKLNARLMALERAFIDPRGLPGRPDYRHVVFSPSVHDFYSGVTFPGIRDSVENYLLATKNNDTVLMGIALEQIKIGVTVIQYSIESAILILDL